MTGIAETAAPQSSGGPLPHVLFVRATDAASLEPWFGDFVGESAEICEVRLFDPARPIGPQFADVRAVVDLGGFGGHALIDAARETGVELWQVLGYGLDHIDVGYVLATGIPLAHTPGSCTAVPLAEHALHLMLTLEKRWRESQAVLASGRYGGPFSGELDGQTLGIVGFGASGRALARRAAAFGMRVLGVDAVVPDPGDPDVAICESVGGLDRFDELLRTADYVSLHLPLTDQTQHLLDADALRQMKSAAVVVNVARGRLIDQAALVEALRTGALRGACLDVYEEEPLPVTHPLMNMENVVLTPHTAGLTWKTSRRRARFAAGNVARLLGGGELEAVVS
jgi:phosphoglycerate dehydrogenase-like enzyme